MLALERAGCGETVTVLDDHVSIPHHGDRHENNLQ